MKQVEAAWQGHERSLIGDDRDELKRAFYCGALAVVARVGERSGDDLDDYVTELGLEIQAFFAEMKQ